VSEEAKARRPVVDALETTEDSLLFAKTDHLIRPYFSPLAAKYPETGKEKAERGLLFWTVIRESYLGFGYNKTQLSSGAVPKGFDGLLHPELKRKIAITLSESAAKTIGAIIKIKGEAFVRKLKAQEIKAYTVSSAALADLIASGEIGASLHIFRNHALVSAERGSPCWVSLVPTWAPAASPRQPAAASLAAMLLVDFLPATPSRFSKNFNMAIRPSTMDSSAGIKIKAAPSSSWKKTRRNGKNSPRKSPNANRTKGDYHDVFSNIRPTRPIGAIRGRATRPDAQADDDLRAGDLQRQGSRSGALRRREERRQSDLVHVAFRRLVQGHGQSL
jgi:hypothetical protein